jgi:hypothetical protein
MRRTAQRSHLTKFLPGKTKDFCNRLGCRDKSGILELELLERGNNMDPRGSKEQWEVAATESGWWKADIIKGKLESEGIPVELRYEAVGRVYGLTVDGLGKVEILVPPESVEMAREILSESPDMEELPWDEKEGG